jgi:hypothetical protein
MVQIQDTYVGKSARFAPILSRTGGEKRLLAVVFTKPTVGARVKPTNHDALSRIEMAFGQFEAISWQVGWAIAKIEIGPLGWGENY